MARLVSSSHAAMSCCYSITSVARTLSEAGISGSRAFAVFILTTKSNGWAALPGDPPVSCPSGVGPHYSPPRLPAALLVHGSGGISAYVVEWIPLLNAMGIALDGFFNECRDRSWQCPLLGEQRKYLLVPRSDGQVHRPAPCSSRA